MPPRRAGAKPTTDETTDETTTGGRDAAAGSSPDSAASSTSRNGTGFIADPGPAHDPESAPEPEPQPTGELLDDLGWDPEVVRGLLTAQGQTLHTFAGKGDDDWVYTRDELRAIAPPLTRILNRYDATRMAASTGDEFALIIGLTGYVGRSIDVRRRAVAAMRDDDDEAEPLEVYIPSEGAVRATAPAEADDELPDVPPTPRRR